MAWSWAEAGFRPCRLILAAALLPKVESIARRFDLLGFTLLGVGVVPD